MERVALLLLCLLGLTAGAVNISQSLLGPADPLSACRAANQVSVCQFRINTDVPLLSMSAVLSLTPAVSSSTVWVDPSNPTGLQPPVAGTCGTFFSGGTFPLVPALSFVRELGPKDVKASWFFELPVGVEGLNATDQLVLQVAFKSAPNTLLQGFVYAYSSSVVAYPLYVSCGSGFPGPCVPPCVQYDLTGDCRVDANDLFQVLAAYDKPCNAPTCYGRCPTDFNNDGITSPEDVTLLLSGLKATCPRPECSTTTAAPTAAP